MWMKRISKKETDKNFAMCAPSGDWQLMAERIHRTHMRATTLEVEREKKKKNKKLYKSVYALLRNWIMRVMDRFECERQSRYPASFPCLFLLFAVTFNISVFFLIFNFKWQSARRTPHYPQSVSDYEFDRILLIVKHILKMCHQHRANMFENEISLWMRVVVGKKCILICYHIDQSCPFDRRDHTLNGWTKEIRLANFNGPFRWNSRMFLSFNLNRNDKFARSHLLMVFFFYKFLLYVYVTHRQRARAFIT